MTLKITVDEQRLLHELHELAGFSDCPDPIPAVTRVVFTERDLQARRWLKARLENVGLDVRVDSVGNTFARWAGSAPELPAVGTGSHIDAIPFSGMYDGTLGVLGGLEAIRSLQTAGFQPERSIELLMFTSEEPTRFGVGCTGSRVMAGLLSESDLDHLTDDGGGSFNVVRQRAGFMGSIDSAFLTDQYYSAWIELHIEQGPELEAEGIDIGIVTAIAAPATMIVEIEGEGGHAGAVLMPKRRDALVAASEIIQEIENIALRSTSPDLVATVGTLTVHPGAINSIPSRVQFSIDLRDIDLDSRDSAKQLMEQVIGSMSERRGLVASIKTLHSDPPAAANPSLIEAAKEACQRSGCSFKTMVSRAYHDSLFVAQFAPISMLFIPCRDGVSHRPDEFSTPEQMAKGVEVLARTLASASCDEIG